MSSKLQSASSSRPPRTTSSNQIKPLTSLKEIEKFIADSTNDFETSSNFNDLKLQAYRTAFDAIMEELKTYRPILAKIKEAYDSNLQDAKKTRKELDEARQNLLVINENCEAKLAEHKSHQIEKLKDAYIEIANLTDRIKEFKENKDWYQAQVDKLKLELSETYQQYRDERDRRKILVSELRATQATESSDASKALQSAEQQQDPVKLALHLEVTKKDLKRATEELSRTKADYGDVVPRREYELQFAILEKKSTDLEKITFDFEKLHSEHTTLLDLHQQISKEREQYSSEAELLRREATPRPNWDELRSVWPEGSKDWKDVTEGNTSAQTVNVIANQFKKSDAITVIKILGNNEQVPVHLRWPGRNPGHPSLNVVHNRNFERLEVSAWIDKIWKNKIIADGKADQDVGFPKLSQVMLNFFKETFNDCDAVVYEYTYSLDSALRKLGDEPYVRLFKDILDDKLHDSVKYRLDWVIANARKAISATAATTKNLNIDQILDSLKHAFPIKEDEDFLEIKRELEDFDNNCSRQESLKREAKSTPTDLNASSDGSSSTTTPTTPELRMVGNTPSLDKVTSELGKYQFLFSQDEHGRYSNFLKLLVKQEESSKEKYLNEIEEGLRGFKEISFSEAKLHLMNLDPEGGKMLNTYLTVGFGQKTFKAAKNYGENISIPELMEGFAKTGIFRAGMRM